MSVHSSILVLFCLLGALGLGYAAFVGFGPDLDRQVDEAALDGMADQRTQGQTPALSGSADRRMDDFGSGPQGTVVTVPLRDRYRQAFGSSTGGRSGGGAAAPASKGNDQEVLPKVMAAVEPAPSTSTSEPDANVLETPSHETAAVTEQKAAALDHQESLETSRYRVIDRGPEVEPGQEAVEGAAQPDDAAVEATTTVPSFDIVRVDPQGNTVLAGRAEPFAEVEVKAGDEVIDRVTATALGEWVSTPITPLQSGDQELSLTASNENTPAVISRQVVVVSIPEPVEQQVVEGSEPVAVLVDREKGGEGRILQAPGRLQGEGQLALKLVDYDDEGAIKLSGEAPPGVPVRIYIDNEPTALVIGDAKGYWITTLDRDLPGGDYTLRLDQLDKEGETVARLETPFTRVTTPPVEGQSKVDYVVVQPGNSLWRIARRLSGDGFNYVYLFEANQAQIRDPDVIYPGQVFEVPAATGIAG